MSKFLIFCIVLFQSFFLFAQDDSLLVEDSSAVQLFLSVGMDYGIAYEHNAFTLDINGGFEYNNIYFGGFGCSIINQITATQDSAYQDMQVDLGYGGFIIGYQFFAEKKIHFFLASQFGWGTVSLSSKETINKVNFMERYFYDSVFLIKPMATIEFTLTPHFFLNAGANYIIMTGLTSLSGFSNNDFNGINYVLSLKYHL